MSEKEKAINFDQFKFDVFTPPGEEEKVELTDLSDITEDEEIETIIETNKAKAKKTEEVEVEEEEEEEEGVEPVDPAPTNTEEKEETELEVSYKPLIESLAEKGILKSVEDWEQFEDTDEGLEKVITETVKDLVEDYKASLPDVVRELTEYVELGGDAGTFLQAKANVSTLNNLEIDSEENQEKVVRAYLANQDWAAEDIDEAIEDYKDSMILEKEAKRALTKLKKVAEKEEQELITRQKQIEEQQRLEYENYLTSIKSKIKESKDIAGLPISEKDKQSFITYLTKVDKNGETEYTKDLAKDYMNNSLALAYFKFKNFNFETIEKKAEQKVVKSLKNKMFKPTTVKPTGATGREQVSKADLEIFKTIFDQQ